MSINNTASFEYIKTKYCIVKDFSILTSVKGYRVDTEFYSLTPDGWLYVRKGFCWDGATGAIDTKDIMLASCVHDIFCVLINEKKLPAYCQAVADNDYRLIQKSQNVPKLRRQLHHLGIRAYQINNDHGTKPEVIKIKYDMRGVDGA